MENKDLEIIIHVIITAVVVTLTTIFYHAYFR